MNNPGKKVGEVLPAKTERPIFEHPKVILPKVMKVLETQICDHPECLLCKDRRKKKDGNN